MDPKLKALKVADLKNILSKASVSVPAKANKQDLITKILGSPAALAVYSEIHPSTKNTTSKPKAQAPTTVLPQTDDLLAPPEEVDWTVDETGGPESTTISSDDAASAPAPSTVDVPSASQPQPPSKSKEELKATVPIQSSASSQEDEELEKRKVRAARFGVPLVESKANKSSAVNRNSAKANDQTSNGTAAHATANSKQISADDPDKLKARNARFGLSVASEAGKKRRAPVEDVDPDEAERRMKRAERFGFGTPNKR